VRGRCTTRQSNAACFQASCGCSGRPAELRKGVRAHQAELIVPLCAVQPLNALQVAEPTYAHGPRRTVPAALAGATAVPPGHPTAVLGAGVRPLRFTSCYIPCSKHSPPCIHSPVWEACVAGCAAATACDAACTCPRHSGSSAPPSCTARRARTGAFGGREALLAQWLLGQSAGLPRLGMALQPCASAWNTQLLTPDTSAAVVPPNELCRGASAATG